MRRVAFVAAAVLLAKANQVPFRFDELSPWNLDLPPNVNATGHLVFETVSSLLQHWPNTRYRNGHSLVLGTVPVATLLYHGRGDARVPNVPDWVATDPEHSYMFCRGQTDTGCWHLTLVAARTLKVLYFDGSSAAKMRDGPMDSQDIVGWGQVTPERYFDERQRIIDICKWGKPWGVDGYVRMEMDFEIMLCDFTVGVEVVAMTNLVSEGRGGPGGPRRSPRPRDPTPLSDSSFAPGSVGSEVILAGAWHDRWPGDRRIQLDLTSLISFYDTDLVPSLVPVRFGQERWDHRLLGINAGDVKTVMARLEATLSADVPSTNTSGIDWDVLYKVVVDRFANRLETAQNILNNTATALTTAKRALKQFHIMLIPYLLHSAVPASTGSEWASPIYKFCATSHTSYIHRTPSLFARLTPSEHLLLGAVEQVNREICRVVVNMWVQGVEAGLDDIVSAPTAIAVDEDGAAALVQSWKKSLNGLMLWLDWSVWIKCRPECSFEEMCYLPTWPFIRGPDEDSDDYLRPQPRCIRRME
ncbi:hypothetical protein C8F01DRAFT_1221901 [Mycena amicta]|nr:hypothetical protein C8F01DRAFT_1221901 [Mycena amicta]